MRGWHWERMAAVFQRVFSEFAIGGDLATVDV
jgi:hypothetical protein